MNLARTFYSTLFYSITPLLVTRLLWRSRKNPQYGARLGERFGVVPKPAKRGGIHFHLVSVGETLSAIGVIESILKNYPDRPIYITSTTPTGYGQVTNRLVKKYVDKGGIQPRITQSYLPFDLPDAVNRFYQTVKPQVSVLMETELWPNLIYAAKSKSINVVLMNARLSEKSAEGYRKWRRITQPMLENLALIACQNAQSATRFSSIAPSASVSVTGNVKYDVQVKEDDLQKADDLKNMMANRPIWIAASTHKGEDEWVLKAHQQVLARFPNALLLLAPRHPERGASIVDITTEMGLTSVLRSQQGVAENEHVLVCDTLGELMALYATADVCFVGGSLVEVGGHNPLEAIALERPVVTGPVVFNFEAVYAGLLEKHAVETCDAQGLGAKIVEILSDKALRHKLVENASRELELHSGAVERMARQIAQFIDV